MMGGYVEFSVYLASLHFILNFYASFVTLCGIFGHLLIFLLISCLLYGILLRFRLPRPSEATVNHIFGSDWGAYESLTGEKKTDNDYSMKIVAHRACGLDAPENSMSALTKVHKEGITAVEFDVRLTSDHVPIVFHDNSLSRMTGVNKLVSETTFEEIRKLDVSVTHPFGKSFNNEKVPTLEEYVLYCIENRIRMFIDLKGAESSLIPIINDVFKQHPKMYELAVVTTFNPIYIYRIRAKDPKIVCSLGWRLYYYSHEEYSQPLGPKLPRTNNLCHFLFLRLLNHVHQWVLWNFGYYILGLSAMLLHKDMITREVVEYWTKRGIRVVAWTVNLPTEKHYFEKILEITYLTDTVINS